MADRSPTAIDHSDEEVTNESASLLGYYNFELDRYTIHQLVHHWVEQFSAQWVRLAIIEAVYQGRYKSISVEQILNLWKRRGQPRHHFNHEFERIVCNKLPQVPDIHHPAFHPKFTDESSKPRYSPNPRPSEPITLQPPTWHSHLPPPPAELISLRASLETEEQAKSNTADQQWSPAPQRKTQSGSLPISFKIHDSRADRSSTPADATTRQARAERSPTLPRLLQCLPAEETTQNLTPDIDSTDYDDQPGMATPSLGTPSERPELSTSQSGAAAETDLTPMSESSTHQPMEPLLKPDA